MSVKITDRNGWKYAKVPRKRGSGKAVPVSLGTKSLEEARTLVKESKLEEIALASRADALTREVWTRLLAGRNLKVRDTLESYESHRHVTGDSADTIRADAGILDRFIRANDLANAPLAALEAVHVSNFINQPGAQKLSTRELWLSVINTWLTYLSDQRWIVVNPALGVVVRIDGLTQEQLISNRHPSFTEEEIHTLLAKVPRADFWHGAILLGFHYGLRLGSVAILEEGNVVANRLRVYTSKGRRVVDEFLHDDIVAWLDVWRPVRPASDLPHLFPVQAAIYESGSALLSNQFARLLTKHGIADRNFSGLRKAATAKRWSAELDELGDKEKRALMAMVASHGFRRVQAMLAHAPGSDTTDKFYMPKQ